MSSLNLKILNPKESTKNFQGATQAENTAIIVRETKANIRTKREFEITHDVSNNYVYVMPKIKTVKLFQTTKLVGAVFSVEGALNDLL